MSAFYASAPVAFALGLMWALTRYVLVLIRRGQQDFRPAHIVVTHMVSRGLVYGAAFWLVLGPFAVLGDWMRGPAGNFPQGGLQAGLFSSAPSPEARSIP